MNSDAENTLIAQAIEGDEEAFACLRRLHEKGLRELFKASASESYLDDLLQKVFVTIRERLPSYQPERGGFAGWTRIVAEDILIAKAQQGEGAAFACLWQLHEKWLRGFLRPRASENDVDDLLQEIFIIIWRKLPAYQPERAGFITWIRKMATYRLWRYYRKTERKRSFIVLAGELATQAERDGVESEPEEFLENVRDCPVPSAAELSIMKEDCAAALQALLDGGHDPERIIFLLLTKVLGFDPLEVVDRHLNQPCNQVVDAIKEALMAEFKHDPEMQKIICCFLDALSSTLDATL
jgi:RNA polymerase sigma factor (sigma-70 family)